MSRTKGALRAVTAVVAGVSLVMLAGCGGIKREPTVAAADGRKPEPCSTPAAASSSRPSATPTQPPTLPAGYRWWSVESAHVKFAAPVLWSDVKTGDSLGSQVADDPDAKEIAERMGATVEQLSQSLAQVDLFLVPPAGWGNAPNLRVEVTELAGLPSYESVSAWLEKTAADKPKLRCFRTAAGKAMDATYSIRVGSLSVHFRTVWVNTTSGVVSVDVAGAEASSTDDIADAVESTIHSV